MRTKKKINPKVKKTLITILIAVGSFIGGIIGQRNEAVGELIDTVVTTVGLNFVENGTGSDTIKVHKENPLRDTTMYIDTIVYKEGPFTVVAYDTFTVASSLNNMNLPIKK